MKKICIILLSLAMLLSLSVFSACTAVPEYEIYVNSTEKVQITDKGFVVEAGETVTIPQGEVYNKNGDFCEDFKVSRVITDENGNRKAGTLQMKHGEVYTVTYFADNGDVQLEKALKLYCFDTILPTLTLMNLQRSYNVGDTVLVKVNSVSNDIDYSKSTLSIKNNTTSEVKELSLTEEYSFVAENESETYTITAVLADINGNKNNLEFNFVIAGEFKDTDIEDGFIWDFEESGYLNNIKVSGESDILEYTHETTNLPADTNGIGVGKGAIKFNLKADERYVFTLINGNTLKISDCNTIGFRLWATEVVDIFEIYNADDNAMYDLSWRANRRGQWQNIEFSPLGVFSADYSLKEMKVVLSCEQDVTVYLDAVYFTPYVEPWRDEDIPDGDLALFDDPAYLDRVSEPLISDSTTFGGSWEYVTSIPGTNDFTGGALKLVSTSDAAVTSDKNSRDGFKFQFFDKLSYETLGGLIIRVYCEDPQVSLALRVVDEKRGEIPLGWYTLQGQTEKWINVIVPREVVLERLDGLKNITHLDIRFIRSNATAVQGQEKYVCYIDKISEYGLDYDKVGYTFADDYDMRIVESVNNTTGTRVPDALANDGWALYGLTGFHKEPSGLRINFGNKDISNYAQIYVRIRTENGAVSVKVNGTDATHNAKYGEHKQYTEINILPLLQQLGYTTLDYIQIDRAMVNGIGIYVDEIRFVKAEDAPKYEDFTINAADILPNAGSNAYKNFEGGNIANVDNVTLGTYQGRDNVLSFTSTTFYNGGEATAVSGGGFYVDFSKYLNGAKIVSSQNFTITMSVYMPSAMGHRVGVIWGNDSTNISYKNKWANPYGSSAGWYTITITSADLRALDGCKDVEMTGIYLGINGIGYTCAIESITVDFHD